MVSAFAVAQGHATIIDDPSVAACGVVTRSDVGRPAREAVLALARARAT